jgi:hypothetical protein
LLLFNDLAVYLGLQRISRARPNNSSDDIHNTTAGKWKLKGTRALQKMGTGKGIKHFLNKISFFFFCLGLF